MLKSDRVDYSARPVNQHRLAAIREFAGRSILDVGCGNGAYVSALANEYEITGVDCQEFAAWADDRDRFSISDAHKLSVPDASVDTVLSFETLEHVRDPEAALKEYFRVCCKNVIITVPNCELSDGLKASGLIYSHWIDRSHVNFWTMGELALLVESVGFSVKVCRYINAVRLGPPLMEALGIGGTLARIGSRVIRSLTRQEHLMTLLIVGQKSGT
jgi:SAM-dependent methyltransferase